MRFLLTFITIILSTQCANANGWVENWRVSAAGDFPPYLVDCVNCNEEEVGSVFYCNPDTETIQLDLYGFSLEYGKKGEKLPIFIAINSKTYQREVTLELIEIMGYAPILKFKFDDELTQAFKTATSLEITFRDELNHYSTTNLATSFETFLNRCENSKYNTTKKSF